MAAFFIHRPVFAWVLAITVMLVGAFSVVSLPISQYPDIAPTTVRISASYTGASAETVENSVTTVIEDGMTGLDGLTYMTSSSSEGSASISLVFDDTHGPPPLAVCRGPRVALGERMRQDGFDGLRVCPLLAVALGRAGGCPAVGADVGEPVGALDAVAHAVPIFTIIIGAETLLNVVLDVYRPRKPGEDPRPGFDSRLLGLLAAPDRIAENIGEALNYQFGVEVSRTWFYLLLKRWWPGLIAVALLVAWGMTSLVVVEPHQRAMVLTFDKPSARC
jgi:Cation/multidrug efflux pump